MEVFDHGQSENTDTYRKAEAAAGYNIWQDLFEYFTGYSQETEEAPADEREDEFRSSQNKESTYCEYLPEGTNLSEYMQERSEQGPWIVVPPLSGSGINTGPGVCNLGEAVQSKIQEEEPGIPEPEIDRLERDSESTNSSKTEMMEQSKIPDGRTYYDKSEFDWNKADQESGNRSYKELIDEKRFPKKGYDGDYISKNEMKSEGGGKLPF